MAQHVPQKKIDDCRELYLEHGGLDHDQIVAEMRARGWRGFTKRNLYARTRGGRITRGWPERFGWDGELFTAEPLRRREGKQNGRQIDADSSYRSEDTLIASDLRHPRLSAAKSPSQRLRVSAVKRKRSKPGIGYANRRTFAREHTAAPRAAMHAPKVNRQKVRRLRGERERGFISTAETQSRREEVSTGRSGVPDGLPPRLSDSAVKNPADADFHTWLKSLPGIWHWDWLYQRYLYERLKRVTSGQCKRLMIFMPPRHGKSELVTVRYSAWRLKQDPSMNIILGSYNQQLANKFSRKIKKVLTEDAAAERRGGEENGSGGEKGLSPLTDHRLAIHRASGTGSSVSPTPSLPNSPTSQSPFPFTRQRPINTVAEWETTEGGGLRAVGVGAGVTGYGANLIVIDDPVKSREQANSERFREKLWDWYNDDLQTRLEPGGTIILIQTRWHEDDLAGRLLREQENGGPQWEIVSLPALAEERLTAEAQRRREEKAENQMADKTPMTNESSLEPSDPELLPQRLSVSAVQSPYDEIGRIPGDALCPMRFDKDELARIRSTMTEMSFAALYQQRPVPQEGGVFKRAWFKHIVDHAPQGLKWKRGYDLAISTKQSADYTASFRVAYDAEGNLYIDGGMRRRIDFPAQRRYMIERMNLERDTEHGIEQAVHGLAVMQELRKMANLRGRRFKGIPVKGGKQERALSWLNLAEEGRLRLVRGHWNKTFVEEAASFPHGSHDDQIDAVSLAVSMFEIRPAKLYVF